jgi:multidrug efflux pump subunit AcrA (membrane-fusion protein)
MSVEPTSMVNVPGPVVPASQPAKDGKPKPNSEGELLARNQRRRTPSVPRAFSESVMPSLRLARSSRVARRVGYTLAVVMLFTLILVAVAPWQQSLSGAGNVIAFRPDLRTQVIQSPVRGRLLRLADNIYENAEVKEGQLIAELRDLDEGYSERLQQQLENSRLSLGNAEQQLEASRRILEFSVTVVQTLEQQVESLTRGRQLVEAAQDAYVVMAEQRMQAEQQTLEEQLAALPQLEAEVLRMQNLERDQIVSLQDLQLVERRFNEFKARVSRSQYLVQAAESDLEGKQNERAAAVNRAQIDIETAEAGLRRARGDVSKAESEVASAEQMVNRANSQYLEMQANMARQRNQMVHAPFDGYLVEIYPNLGTTVLKEGDPICKIVPKTSDRAVQIWVQGNDAPLICAGRHVRLQFEGWPAVQFAGWPSVAVGTFGGEVVSVDAIDDGRGNFRVLVRPDEEDIPWPEGQFLRQGARAKGWVLLEQVPLWYEIWRRLNGFPPVVTESLLDRS